MRNSKRRKAKAEFQDDLPPSLDPRRLRFVGFGLEAVRRHAASKRRVIELEPDVAGEFVNANEVNEALRLVKPLRSIDKLRRQKTACETTMTLQDFKGLLEAQPFEPFRVIMSSGLSYEVRHPEMAKLLRTKLLIFLDPDKDGIADQFRMCSLLHVTTVEPIGNGKRRRH